MFNRQKSGPLQGCTVLVTRPAHQADGLCQMIQAYQAEVVRLPALDIKTYDHAPLQTKDWDIVIWTSANAVYFCSPKIIQLLRPCLHIPIGSGTYLALQSQDLKSDFVPIAGTTSESLLSELNKRYALDKALCLILKGKGGRQTLMQGLRQLNANVECLEVYQRTMPVNCGLGDKLEPWFASQKPVAVAASTETLLNLMKLFTKAQLPVLLQSPLIVVSERTKETAYTHGFQEVYLAKSAKDQHLLECLLKLNQNC